MEDQANHPDLLLRWIADLARPQAAAAARSLRRHIAALIAALLAGVALIAAAGCAVAALWLAVAPHLGQTRAAALSAAVLVLLACAALLLARQMTRRGAVAAPLNAVTLNEAFKSDKSTLLAAALLAGVNAGRRPV